MLPGTAVRFCDVVPDWPLIGVDCFDVTIVATAVLGGVAKDNRHI